MRGKREKVDVQNLTKTLKSTAKEYCENCSAHGFSYWVSSKRTVDRLFWVTVVVFCFAGSSYFVKTAIDDWNDNPTQTTVNALGIPITTLNHPAITICKPNGIYDVGEYLRAVFDNFQFTCKSDTASDSCQSAELLRAHYSTYSNMTEEVKAGYDDVSTSMLILQMNLFL